MRLSTLSLLVAVIAGNGLAQPLPVALQTRPLVIDSGYRPNATDREQVVFEVSVASPGAAWMRVFLRETDLGPESRLRLTSLLDGAVQYFDRDSLRAYSHGSAYFNGSEVRIELLGAPRTRANRLRVDAIEYTLADARTGDADEDEDSICGLVDDRVLFADPRIGRGVSGISACTWWLFENEYAIATAGHCVDNGSAAPWIVGFNIPLSTSSGNMIHPPPDDQYAIDPSTVQWLNSGSGADWAVMATVRNSNHGLYPGEKQGAWFELGPVPTQAGTTIRITGNGRVTAPVPLSWNSVTKTHTGPLDSTGSTRIRYRTDTTGGNSGSPVIHEESGKAVGIHTHGGCTSSGGANIGTRIDRPDLASAISQVLANKTVASTSSFGPGCAGTNGVPSLALSASPVLGSAPSLSLSNSMEPTPTAGALLFGSGQTSIQIIGCTLLMQPPLVGVSIAVGATGYQAPLPIPEDAAFEGLQLFLQGITLDNGAPGGAAFSPGLGMTLGY